MARDIFSTAWPTDDHAVCIFPFRRYEVCGMILYAKSSLELIVNNRIGKVGIRPGAVAVHPPPKASFGPVRGATPTTLRGASHLALESARCTSLAACPSVRPSVSPSIRPSDCP